MTHSLRRDEIVGAPAITPGPRAAVDLGGSREPLLLGPHGMRPRRLGFQLRLSWLDLHRGSRRGHPPGIREDGRAGLCTTGSGVGIAMHVYATSFTRPNEAGEAVHLARLRANIAIKAAIRVTL
jgi:hypothetical protein